VEFLTAALAGQKEVLEEGLAAAVAPPLSQMLRLLPHPITLLFDSDAAQGIAVVLTLVGSEELRVEDGE
jgi:hypothetical protein